MPSNEPRTYSLALNGWGFWLGCLAVALLLTRLGLGWLVALPVIFLVVLLTLPVVMVLLFRWWVSNRLATDACPVCRFESQAMEGTRFFCPSCGEPLYVADRQFFRQSPPGTVEVEVLED
ncbi:MAG: hypothetical protein AAFX40_12440 [Cyanobacteria bacterium J06639_1]